MFVGALLDAGADAKELRRQLSKLALSGYEIQIRKEKRGGFAGTRFELSQPHSHSHSHSHHGHEHRGIREIESILKRSKLSKTVIEKSLQVFREIAKVEAQAHGIAKEKVHFHELGAIDSIVDVVAAILCLEMLEIEAVKASALNLGSGFVHAEHGVIPVPAPGTIGLLKKIPVRFGDSKMQGELTTPTGAALLVSLSRSIGEPVEMRPTAIGYGVGQRENTSVANLLRVVIGDSAVGIESDQVYLLETNLDDMSGESIAYAMERILEAGALDAYLIPIHMKKNRPGVILAALVEPAKRLEVEDVFFKESSSLGIRRQLIERTKLARQQHTLKTKNGPVRYKLSQGPGGTRRVSAEFEDLRAIAKKTKKPLQELILETEAAARRIEISD